MALVRVRGPLKQLAGGRSDHTLDGTTVAELLEALERAQPDVGLPPVYSVTATR